MAMIELEKVTVDFDTVRACDHVDLSVEKGDVFGVVGFSGAGKSTLVRTINLLQRPTEGRVLIEGEDYTALPAAELRKRRQRIGMIFQNFNLFMNRNVLDNVLYPIRNLPGKASDKRAKALELLSLVGISDKATAYPRQLSGGQQQRAAIARALVSDPDILLCDEATSALDPSTTKSILALLQDINQRLGITIVIITHQMEVVKEICNKCAVMQDGRIIEVGKAIDIFASPKEPLTQAFVQTTTHHIETLRKLQRHQLEINPDDTLVQLKYLGASATEPLITDIFERFQVRTNILAGAIEVISGEPVGNLIVSFSGTPDQIQSATQYLQSKNTEVTIIPNPDHTAQTKEA